MVFFLAISSMSRSIYSVRTTADNTPAKIDGASSWQMFRHITLPLIMPFILVAVVIRMIDALKAFGAEVIVCPTNVDPEDPRSYYSVSSRLEKDVPNSWKANQYDNPSNAVAHYEQTGPEIWEQTDGKITHLVVGVGTGGTICGAGKYLKEKNPNIQVLGIDTYGSVFKKYKETGIFDKNEIYPYITEGIGEDILPKNVDFSLIDLFEKVTDKDAALAETGRDKAGDSAKAVRSLLERVRPVRRRVRQIDICVGPVGIRQISRDMYYRAVFDKVPPPPPQTLPPARRSAGSRGPFRARRCSPLPGCRPARWRWRRSRPPGAWR